MIDQALLKGFQTILRPPQESDKQDRLAWGRDAEFRRMVGGDPRTLPSLNAAEVEAWYGRVVQEPYHWIIEAEGRCIGTARLHAIDPENRRAKYAIGIFAPELRGRGLGTEATRLVLAYAFDVLSLHRVELRVLAFNARAIACYERCGFVREGVEREGAWIGGQWQSDVLMSILEQEYRAMSLTTE
ncbi:MAG: acetyltransferase, family [Chthonomonadaceae bacterium]|nr:acetyltransferase, family [Chthonomonadaceae bacterium]